MKKSVAAEIKRLILPRLWVAGRHAWIIVAETIKAFIRNDGLRQASSLAYATILALIPVLLLLTYVFTLGIGSSHAAMNKIEAFASNIIPQFGDVVVREVEIVSKNKRTAGLINALVMLWATSPLVGEIRSCFNSIFKVTSHKPFWLNKLMDIGVACLFVIGITLIAAMDTFLTFFRSEAAGDIPWILRQTVAFSASVILLLGLYRVFIPRLRLRDLLFGAIITTLLWFVLKPSFTLFITYDPNFGVTFGSFKALFVIIIWIYCSMAVLILGAELIAALNREETLIIHRMIKGEQSLRKLGSREFVLTVRPETAIFREGDTGGGMYHLLHGEVAIHKKNREIATLGKGSFFGEMSYLLDEPRTATAIAKSDCELLSISDTNLTTLMREYPETVREMLTELARRLRQTSQFESGNTSAC